MNPRLRNGLIGIATLAVVVNLGVVVAERLAPDLPHRGPPGSSFNTYHAGLSAYAELLERNGRDVTAATRPVDELLDPRDTVVALGLFGGAADVPAFEDFLARGGRLITDEASGLTFSAFGTIPTEGATTYDTISHGGVTTLTGTGGAVWDATDGRVLAASEAGPVVVEWRYGAGTVVALADWSMLTNEYLAESDNAAFAVAITDGRPVLFDEIDHGYTDPPTGRGFPDSWRWALRLLGVAVAVWLISISRRFGPPEPERRPLPPPRREYIDAVAGTLAKTTDPSSVVSVLRTHALRRLAPRATAAEARQTATDRARTRGLSDAQIEALFGDGPADPMSVGAALATLVDPKVTGTEEDRS